MTMASDDGNTDYSSNSNDHDHNGDPSEQNNHPNQNNTSSFDDDQILDVFESRITQLEQIVARQEVELQKLRKECNDLTEASFAFARVVELLRQAAGEKGITSDALSPLGPAALLAKQKKRDDPNNIRNLDKENNNMTPDVVLEYLEDDSEIFGTAPSSVIDAADAAGAAILAGMLGGKQRMLVDVRDAELSRDAETLVQFLELAILPVAAGLEGLQSKRNRVKIVFPTVSQLLQYRRSMALAAPEVVALSTLGFDPVEQQDKLVVLVAPAPDDEDGLNAMNRLLESSDGDGNNEKKKNGAGDDNERIETEPLHQPVVVINHHMLPISGPAQHYEVAYHLRLLSVSYMSHVGNIGSNSGGVSDDDDDGAAADGDRDDNTIRSSSNNSTGKITAAPSSVNTVDHVNDDATVGPYNYSSSTNTITPIDETTSSLSRNNKKNDDGDDYLQQLQEAFMEREQLENQDFQSATNGTTNDDDDTSTTTEDELLEAAMKHAHEIGTNQGITRAMVIRAYPKPWHVFVDTSPDTDADFEVAATFDSEPTQDEINFSIVECLEGSDREDELVAQQMQEALEAGQLDRVADMMGINPEDVAAASSTVAVEGSNSVKADSDLSKDNGESEKSSDSDSDETNGGTDESGSNNGTEENFYNDFDLFDNEDSV